MRLSEETLSKLPPSVQRPRHARTEQAVGIVHFGIGAFHRAHQAVYTDVAMDAGDRHWAIVGVSLRSPAVAAQLNPQQGLFSLATRQGSTTNYRVIGSVRQVLVAPTEATSVLEAIAAPSVQVLTFTITEKGYCAAADGSLDHLLANDGSVYRFLAEGLALRRQRGHGGATLLCCDNLANNGQRLQRLLRDFLERRDPDLADWVDRHCAFPSSMVDRIVPATTAADDQDAKAALGMDDHAHVATEPYTQWVIEEDFRGRRPSWEIQGAEFVTDVRPYEMAKLRMLNGAHSALAYIGLMRGYRFVHEAIADADIRRVVERLMREEAAPSVATARGQDLQRYAAALLDRFGNAALNHRLEQIAMDGSQKVPQRWLETLAFHGAAGRACESILIAMAAWLLHVRGDLRRVEDPMADALAAAWQQAGEGQIVSALFGARGVVSPVWTPSATDIGSIRQAMKHLLEVRS